jgi:hypothetical protein
VAAAFVAFFAGIGFTPSFGAALVLEAFFGANGTADFDGCAVVTTLALDDVAFALAETTLGFVAAVVLAATTFGFVADALLLTATTLGFVEAVLALG